MAATDTSKSREKLTGDFGLITRVSAVGSEVTSTASDALDAGNWLEVTELASSNSKFEGLNVGDLFYVPVDDWDAASGDKYMLLTEVTIGFATGWSIELARNPIDTTTLKDTQSTSIFGRPSTTGSINGFLVANDSQADVFMQRFMRTIKISGTGGIEVLEKSSDPLTFIGYSLKRESNRPYLEAYYLPRMDIGTINVGSEVGGLIDFNAPLTLRSGEITRFAVTFPTS